MKTTISALCCAALVGLVSGPLQAQDKAAAQQQKAPAKVQSQAKQAAPKAKSAQPRRAARVEQLECRLGTEDRHARIAVEVSAGRVQSFAYYSKWKPRTCSVYIKRDDAYSKWEDTGRFSTVTTEWGAFLIENRNRDVHFIFRDVQRERYCGMEGTITGSLTVFRGRSQCELDGVMDEQLRTEPEPTPETPPITSAGT